MKKFVLGITLVLAALFMSACNLSDTFLNSQNSKNNPTDSALSSDITSNQNTESTVNSANANNDIDIAEKNINIDVKPTNDGLLCAFITNNNDFVVDEIEYVVILYKNDEIVTVDHEKDVYDVPSKKTITEKVSTYGDDYDNVKVYLNQAHTFN